MEISLNAQVNCSDGPVGKSVRAVVNPVTEAITHITVQPKGMGETEHLVPLEDISESAADSVTLKVTKNQFYLYPTFVSHRFLDLEEAGVDPEDVAAQTEAHKAMDHVLWPFVTAEGHLGEYADVLQIPADEIAIHRGAPVEATDGRVGEVSELVINAENAHVTHVVLHKGHVFGHKDLAVPISEVDRVDEGVVYLKLDKAGVKSLPELDIKR